MSVSLLDAALALAKQGFHVFPIAEGKKEPPAIKDFPRNATRDENKIKIWWNKNPNFNIGISTSRFGNDEALIVVDIDNKGEKSGSKEVERLKEQEGKELPKTYSQTTPNGGIHLFYRHPKAVTQGTNKLAKGIDIRSRGGYVLGAPSILKDVGCYQSDPQPLVPSPGWVVDACGERNSSESRSPTVVRAIRYLNDEAPIAKEGDAGDETTFKVAAHVKDMGVGQKDCLAIMLDNWNERCEPPWPLEALVAKVANAYRYGQNSIGSQAPEVQFDAIESEKGKDEDKALHPFQILNAEYAYLVQGGGDVILHETKDENDNFDLQHIAIDVFHRKLASYKMNYSGKDVAVSKLWIVDKKRRSYDGLCFVPGKKAPKRFYNLWRGFTVEPQHEREANARSKDALEAFLEHAKKNVCMNDEKLYVWLISYFAHLVQKPWELPSVALVFRGKKGVGKNALVERVGHLLGTHFAVVSSKRHLTGNFNSLLENKLMLVLDEAFWSGDKDAEGSLKALITGAKHVIERKGKEPYKVDNRLRVVIIGNEDWLVPATEDERRYAVFNVGEDRRQDLKFFTEMREGMEQGGYALLLKYLLEFDASAFRPSQAPSTEGLLDQKIKSLDSFYRWWFECLNAGEIVGSSDFAGRWPQAIDRSRFRSAFFRYSRERNIGGRMPDEQTLGKKLRDVMPLVDNQAKITRDGERVNAYKLPKLGSARESWEKHIGHKVKWESESEIDEEKSEDLFL